MASEKASLNHSTIKRLEKRELSNRYGVVCEDKCVIRLKRLKQKNRPMHELNFSWLHETTQSAEKSDVLECPKTNTSNTIYELMKKKDSKSGKPGKFERWILRLQ